MEKHPIRHFFEALARPAVIDDAAMFDRMKRASDYIGALSRIFFLITLIAFLYYKVDPATLPVPWPLVVVMAAKVITLAFLAIVLIVLLVPFWVYTNVMMAKIILPSREWMMSTGIHPYVFRYGFQLLLLLIIWGIGIIILGLVHSIDFSHL